MVIGTPEIQITYSNIREFSFSEKTENAWNEEKVNAFLEAILEFKKELKYRCDKIDELYEAKSKLTCLQDRSKENLQIINDIIASLKNLHSALLLQLKAIQPIKEKGIAVKEIEDFELAISDVEESYDDLDYVFFRFPNDKEMQKITKELEQLFK